MEHHVTNKMYVRRNNLLLLVAVFGLGLASGFLGRTLVGQPIYVDPRASKVVLFNNTADTLNYVIVERRSSRFMKWKPCDHPAKCGGRGIPPGKNASMPYKLIYQWYPGCEVVVYYWSLKPDSSRVDAYIVEGPYEEYSITPAKAVF